MGVFVSVIGPLAVSSTLGLALTFSVVARAAPGDDPTDFFEMRVRPILANHCYACHTGSELGGLRVDSLDGLLKGGNSGPAIVPGKPDDSLLIRAVRQTDARLKMPVGGRLKDQDIADLATWIQNGASWPQSPAPAESRKKGFELTSEERSYWAFQPIRETSLPEVRDSGWPKSPIDRFIMARLEGRGLTPVKLAGKGDLIRRATYDLIGLPPTPEEVDAFVKDTSPKAFEKVVDRLLTSPHYGERWGRHWLDVARYGEDDVRGAVPAGYEPYENAFRYRDWVMEAFNRDMPYDLFVQAQIAGDLLKRDDRQKLISGMGLFGLGPWYFDLADAPQARANEQNDRVDMIGRGFLGLTVACARCHDHKYDPISVKDYYALAGVFASSEYREYPLVASNEVEEYKAKEKHVKDEEALLKSFSDSQSLGLAEMMAHKTSRYMMAAWLSLGPPKADPAKTAAGQKLDKETLERWISYLRAPEAEQPYLKPWKELLTKSGPSEEEARKVADDFQSVVLALIEEKHQIDEQNRIVLDQAKSKRGAPFGFLPNGFALYDGDTDNCFGLSVVVKSLARDKFMLWSDMVGERSPGNRAKKEPGVFLYKDDSVERFLGDEARDYLHSLNAELKALKAALPPHYPYLQILGEAPQPVNLKVHLRGSPYNLGDEVPRRFIAVLSTDAEANTFRQGSGRLELAEAIAHHPLTARVMVNRIWQHHFGRGIVATLSNFGKLGDRPSEPELLDYLARRFIEGGYSVKTIHREIMLSATYQLSTAYSEHDFTEDPDNRLFWRTNRRRLDAEAIRDSLLLVSGDLDGTLGGPSAELTPDNRRRSVYGKISRFKLDPYLALFDFPDPGMTAEQRNVTDVPVQGLFFMNSPLMERESARLVERLSKEAGDANTARIRRAYWLLYGREATGAEIQAGLEFLTGSKGPAAANWAEYAQALLSSNEFVFVN